MSYWATPPRQRLEALTLLGSVLQITPAELERATAAEGAALGLRAGAKGGGSGPGGRSAADSTAFAQLGSQFVAFLEKESANNKAAQGFSPGATERTATSGVQQGSGSPAGGPEPFEGRQQQFSLAQIDQMVSAQRERLALQRRPQATTADNISPKQHRDSLTGAHRVPSEYFSTSSSLHSSLKDTNGMSSASQLAEVPLDDSHLLMESTADALQHAVSGARAFEITPRPVPSTGGLTRQFFTHPHSPQSNQLNNSYSYTAATSRPMISSTPDRSAATGPIFIQETELGNTIPQFTTPLGGLTPSGSGTTTIIQNNSGSISALGGDVIDL